MRVDDHGRRKSDVFRSAAPRTDRHLRRLVEAAIPELADHCGVAMVKEQGFAAVQRGDARHLVVGELEVEHVDVFAHALRPHRLLDDDDIALDQPTQDDLSHRLPMSGPDRGQRGIGEEVVSNGPHDSICTPRSRINFCSAARWKKG